MINKKVLISICVSVLFFGGCSKNAETLSGEVSDKMMKEKQYRDAVSMKPADYRKEALEIGQKTIDVSFYKTPISSAMRDIASMVGVGFDESFLPSNKYELTLEHKGTLNDFLSFVKQSTGVSYKYRNNVLQVANRQVVDEAMERKLCKAGQLPTVKISLNDVDGMEVFKYFNQKYKYNFTFDMKYNQSSVGGMGKSSLFYSGCDSKEALLSFAKSVDFIIKPDGDKRFVVQDYKMEHIDVPTYFDYKYTSGQTMGESSASSGGGSTVTIEEKGKDDFLRFLESYKSPDGVISISNRGYIVVLDRPKKVDELKRLIKSEINKQSPIDLQLSIIRVSVSDKINTGVDFSMSLSRALGNADGSAMIGTGDFTANVPTGIHVEAVKDGMPAVFRALEELGETSVVREYNVRARNGILSTFRAVDRIPYITTSVMATGLSSQVMTEAKFALAGIIINMLPQMAERGETLNVATNILISEYLGDKTFATPQGDIILPRISENEIQVPVSIKMGETAVLTGFNLKEDTSTRSGAPWAIGQDLFFTERLFGSFGDDSESTQIVVVITPTKVEEY